MYNSDVEKLQSSIESICVSSIILVIFLIIVAIILISAIIRIRNSNEQMQRELHRISIEQEQLTVNLLNAISYQTQIIDQQTERIFANINYNADNQNKLQKLIDK